MAIKRRFKSRDKAGRPTIYTEKLANEICEYLASGKPLTKFCKQEGAPKYCTIMRWLWRESAYKKDWNEKYAMARKQQAEHFVDDIIEISDDGTNDYIEKTDRRGKKVIIFNKEHVLRSKLRCDSRKWSASKMEPKKYGDSSSIKLSDADSGPVTFVVRYEDKKIPEENT